MNNTSEENICVLQKVPFLQAYGKEILARFVANMKEETFQTGEKIIQVGETAEKLYIIKKGKVRVYRDKEEIAILSTGDFFGEMSLLMMQQRRASVSALEPTETFTLGKTEFLSLMQEGFFKDPIVKEELFKRMRENFYKKR
jgi:CRP-like cAMP-binding protein